MGTGEGGIIVGMARVRLNNKQKKVMALMPIFQIGLAVNPVIPKTNYRYPKLTDYT